jgi:fibronectin type 3 domain-containing protein
MRALRGIFSFLAFLIFIPVLGYAASIGVSWNANTEPDLAGYKIYCGDQSRTYGSGIDVGRVTSYQVSNVESGRTYYVAVTAYDSSGNESGYSAEASVNIPLVDMTPPTGTIQINGGSATSSSRGVALTLAAADSGGTVAGMRFSNDGQIWSSEVAYAASQQWVLTAGDGMKTVYVNFRDAAGNWMSTPARDTIELRLDTDGDGLPDSWEVTYGLDPNNPGDSSGDLDGDGISNLEEYYSSSNPTSPSDNMPVANAGADQTVNPTRVYLDGSQSRDPNGDALQYTWSQVAGPVSVQIENATTERASFVGTRAGLYRFMLKCFDGKASASDTVDVTIRNAAPSVSAGNDMTVDVQTLVTLHAAGADPNGDALSYQWRLVSGTGATLPGMASQDIAVTFNAGGQFRFSVTCSDGLLTSAADEIIVTVNPLENQAPTANAGQDQDVQIGQRVTLDGSASSDPDGDSLSYTWRQVAGIQVALQGGQTASPYFDTISEGTREFELVVSDGAASSVPDRVVVRVLKQNNAPAADAGDDIFVYVGDLVTLNAANSFDADGDTLTYSWTQTSGAGVALNGSQTVRPSFTPTTSGVLTFAVRVSDGWSVSQDSVTVTVDNVNQVPVADAGDDRTANVGETVSLDGRASYDPDGDTISYIWSQISGTRVSASGSNTATPSFTPTEPGTYVFELKVYDGTDTSSPDIVTVTVQQEEVSIQLLSPQTGSVVSDNPTFQWNADGMVKFKVYASLDKKRFTNIYSGSSTSCSMHPVLWYWFIPSGTTIHWAVVGYDAKGQSYTSSYYSVRKR